MPAPLEVGRLVEAESFREDFVVVTNEFTNLVRVPQVVEAFVTLGVGVAVVLVRVEVEKAIIVGAPAIAAGMSLAYFSVFYPPAAGVTASLVAGCRTLPSLTLEGAGAFVVMVEIASLVGLPYLAAVFLTSLRSVSGNSLSLIQADTWN